MPKHAGNPGPAARRGYVWLSVHGTKGVVRRFNATWSESPVRRLRKCVGKG